MPFAVLSRMSPVPGIAGNGLANAGAVVLRIGPETPPLSRERIESSQSGQPQHFRQWRPCNRYPTAKRQFLGVGLARLRLHQFGAIVVEPLAIPNKLSDAVSRCVRDRTRTPFLCDMRQ